MSTELAVDEDVTVHLSLPKKFKVLLLNDDTTPMDFVIELLMSIFNKTATEAEAITMNVHVNGKDVAGIYYFEIAEQKVHEATTTSRRNGFPLSFDIEEV